jgi:phosphoglycerate dehydrogenase-like enzyme
MRFAGIFANPRVAAQFVRQELRRAMAEFGEYQEHILPPAGNSAPSELAGILRHADVALTAWGSPPLPLELLRDPARRLKYVCNLTGSVRAWVPRQYIEAGIAVTNWGDGPMWYLAEGNLALMLACVREMPRLRRHMLEQPTWGYKYAAPSATFRRKVVGFVGMGAIGRMLLDLLKPFEIRALCYDPYAPALPEGVERCATLNELFARSRVVTLQCGLTPETTGMIGREQLDLLPPHAIFINTARGKIVREAELVEFLRRRPDVFAGLDVFEKEPLPKDSPLLQMDNVICYPHSVGSAGEDVYDAADEFAAANLRAFCRGLPLRGAVSAAAYDRMT